MNLRLYKRKYGFFIISFNHDEEHRATFIGNVRKGVKILEKLRVFLEGKVDNPEKWIADNVPAESFEAIAKKVFQTEESRHGEGKGKV